MLIMWKVIVLQGFSLGSAIGYFAVDKNNLVFYLLLSSTSPDPRSTVTPHSTEGVYSILLSHNKATRLDTLFINIFW